jgi:hypothetical protein
LNRLDPVVIAEHIARADRIFCRHDGQDVPVRRRGRRMKGAAITVGSNPFRAAVTPDQGPVAAFSATLAPAGFRPLAKDWGSSRPVGS